MDEHEQVTEREVSRDVAAAAAVHAAKREIDGAIAELAASPLDVDAAERMREVLASPKLRKVRKALGRLQPVQRPHLSVVSTEPAATSTPVPRNSRRDVRTSARRPGVPTDRPRAVSDISQSDEPEEPATAIVGGVA